MILFFDTETTGFPSSRRSSDDPKQAHLVQIAAQLVTPDNRTVMEYSAIVKCPIPIPEAASKIHGITDDISAKYGVEEATAVSFFLHLMSLADTDAAHNIEFDSKIINFAINRSGLLSNETRMANQICTMKKVRALGDGSANLGDCMKRYFDEDHALAHDAMADTIACRRLYFKLMNGGEA